MWLVVAVALTLILAATEVVLGAIKNHSGAISNRLYVVVFAAASVSSLVVSFFALEFIGNLRDGQVNGSGLTAVTSERLKLHTRARSDP
jgi:hypothetical protein